MISLTMYKNPPFHRPYTNIVSSFNSMPKLHKTWQNSNLTLHYANMNAVELPGSYCKYAAQLLIWVHVVHFSSTPFLLFPLLEMIHISLKQCELAAISSARS